MHGIHTSHHHQSCRQPPSHAAGGGGRRQENQEQPVGRHRHRAEGAWRRDASALGAPQCSAHTARLAHLPPPPRRCCPPAQSPASSSSNASWPSQAAARPPLLLRRCRSPRPCSTVGRQYIRRLLLVSLLRLQRGAARFSVAVARHAPAAQYKGSTVDVMRAVGCEQRRRCGLSPSPGTAHAVAGTRYGDTQWQAQAAVAQRHAAGCAGGGGAPPAHGAARALLLVLVVSHVQVVVCGRQGQEGETGGACWVCETRGRRRGSTRSTRHGPTAPRQCNRTCKQAPARLVTSCHVLMLPVFALQKKGAATQRQRKDLKGDQSAWTTASSLHPRDYVSPLCCILAAAS